MSQGSSDVTVDVEGGAEIHAEERENTNVASRSGSGSGIFPIAMVREPFRSVDKNSYTPDCVPIGPYHANRSSPRLEQVKLRCVDFLEESAGGGLARLVEGLQPQARQHYGDGVGREQLSRVLLHDGCYLLVCTVNYDVDTASGRRGTSQSTSSGSQHMAQSEAHDDVGSETVVRDTVFLVENQIPFFVLDSIHQRVTQGARRPLLQEIEQYVRKLLSDSLYVSPDAAPARLPERPSHLLHLVHSYFEPPSQLLQLGGRHAWWHQATNLLLNRRPNDDASSPPLLRTARWRRATEYCKYGNVRFKRRSFDGERWTVLDLLLQGGTLWIPRLRVDSMTWTVLRNLMALEEHMSRRPVTAYCVFMSQVACKVEDVETLQRQGILELFLASDEVVARGFAGLCKGVVMDVDNLDRNYLKPIWRELHERCNNTTNTTIGSFRHKHCSDPMYVAAFITAAFFFILQLAQVILALISVLQQRKN